MRYHLMTRLLLVLSVAGAAWVAASMGPMKAAPVADPVQPCADVRWKDLRGVPVSTSVIPTLWLNEATIWPNKATAQTARKCLLRGPQLGHTVLHGCPRSRVADPAGIRRSTLGVDRARDGLQEGRAAPRSSILLPSSRGSRVSDSADFIR